MTLPIAPPVEPMLAQIAQALPAEGEFLYEPKWDGFRAIVFRDGADVYIQSRDGKPFDRYFPDLHESLAGRLPANCVVDGEIVIATAHGLDFDALQLRLHPASSRVAMLAAAQPASFVAFDVLVSDGRDVTSTPQHERRALLEAMLGKAEPPLYLTPATMQRTQAEEWLQVFEGAGLDGVIAKPLALKYTPGKRAMLKVKHVRTADCVVAGFRWYKDTRDAVGSLLLGLYDESGLLHHVGFTSGIKTSDRPGLTDKFEKIISKTSFTGKAPGGPSRWSTKRSAEWQPVRPVHVVEVCYDHVSGDRFRHGTKILRWRPDKKPALCRMDQLRQKLATRRQREAGATMASLTAPR